MTIHHHFVPILLSGGGLGNSSVYQPHNLSTVKVQEGHYLARSCKYRLDVLIAPSKQQALSSVSTQLG